MDMIPDQKLLDAALRAVQHLGLHWTIQAVQPRARDLQPDALIRMGFRGHEQTYAAEMKRNLRPGTLGATLHYLTGQRGKPLLVLDYATPQIADELKAREIQFIDTAGNAYLNAPPLFVWIRGQRQQDVPARDEGVGRAFQATGLQVLFALLCKPELVGRPYREIAVMAGVAHGTVGWVMPELPRLGFVIEIKKARRLVEGERLLKQWAEAYAARLRPKLLIGRYTATDLDWTADIDATQYNLLMGGETAARRITKNLRPQTATFYGRQADPDFLTKFRLLPGKKGNVEILRKFWDFEATRQGLVPDVLTYADLLATGDARCIENAEEMYGGIINRLE